MENAQQAAAQSQDVEVKPVQMVILVDESGSISDQDMVREQDAASLISQAELSPKSTVSVVGFASDSGTRPAVDVVCPPLVLAGAPERERISQCVRDLRKRTTSEGSGTDHAEALKQALSYLEQGSSAESQKLIFLLTDGVLDVSDSSRYGVGKSALQRNDAAREVIRGDLTKARENGVQIWPLGFGKVDKGALDQFAQGGFQNSCGPGGPKPEATVVSGSADVTAALLRSFSSGRCAGVGPVDQNELGSGGRLEVAVSVPAIATDGSIVVVKHDGRVAVEFVDPQGNAVPKSGQTPNGQFSVSGESGAVEVLHIVDPLPGTWHARLTSLPDVPPQSVLTTVTWQGAAQATLLIDPPSPAVGQQLNVSLQVLLRGGKPVTDPKLLQGLDFSVEMDGPDLPAQPLVMRDNGQDPDSAPDGTYSGRTTIPTAASEQVSFRGKVSGLGISAADAVATVKVAPGVPTVLVTSSLPTLATTVAPGGSAQAQVTVTNNSGQRERLRIEVQPAAGVAITVPVAVHEIDPGGSTFAFQLEVGANSSEGPTTGKLRVVDDRDPTRIFHEKGFTFGIARPEPPFPWLAVLTAIAGALVLAALMAVFLSRRRSQEVRDLTVQSIRNGFRHYLEAEERNARIFPFTISNESSMPLLEHASPGDPTAYVLSRSRSGVRIRTPYGDVRDVQLGQEIEVDEGLTLVVTPTVAGDVEPGGAAALTAEYETQPTIQHQNAGATTQQQPNNEPFL